MVAQDAYDAVQPGPPRYARANAVRDYFVSRGISASRLRTATYGEDDPEHANAHEDTRRLNRRVALVVKLQS